MDFPQPVKDDLGDVLALLASEGLEPAACQFSPEAFGNYVVQFQGSNCALEITRDRSQYFLGGNRRTLESLGLWRALDSMQELEDGLRIYLAAAP